MELAGRVRRAVESLDAEYWVTAEIAQMNLNLRSGHCYLDIVEKKDEEMLAQMRATIWNRKFKSLGSGFKKVTGSELAAGMKVLLNVEVRFHEVYGLSLNVLDIDPSYTLGEMARKRRETVERLRKEGILEKNREVPFPLLPTRVAVVSSETSAGFGDFMDTLRAGGYGFEVTLYPAYVQGERAEASILKALGAIKGKAPEHDVVAVIRGGGSQVDLSCFDSYGLAREVALFPLPVLMGIGHERDETVADMAAHLRLITPTAVAGHLVGRMEEFESRVLELSRRLKLRAGALVQDARHGIRHLASVLLSGARVFVSGRRHKLAMAAGGFRHLVAGAMRAEARGVEQRGAELPGRVKRFISGRAERLRGLEEKVRLMDPANVLKRGYSITISKGRAVTDAGALSRGERITTLLARGSVESIVDDTGDESDA
jgi:exodeoxyribonuclease VII large subunit